MFIKEIKRISSLQEKFILKLRNKSYVRVASLNSKKITYKNHILWIENFKKNKNKLFLVKKNHRNIGYIRGEKDNDFLNVSWALDKKYHGYGYMSKALKIVTERPRDNISKFKALILKKNIASIKVAQKNGFKLAYIKSTFYVYHKILEKPLVTSQKRDSKKYKVTFLFDSSNLWFEKQLRNYNFRLNKKYVFKISKSQIKVKNQDIVFPISYTKILPESFLKKNKLVVIAHSSKLPKDKGFAPLQNQILRNKNKAYMTLIKAEKEVDTGPIYFQNSFMLDGTELNDEIRNIQGVQLLKIIKQFLVKFPKVKSTKQIGKGNFNRRMYPKDSELDINKTIKEQFNNMRINDNELYPSFFKYRGKKYILKIYKN